ncbi:AI-2E family transporter [Cytobacillus gottheilii]|uniref:AI-2E family transporter n=1 Tax=Cytobacillus gottheilii TaxID=859144 RepID=UPI0009BB2CFB|nr:AI-2E family transporter [Cytobacillus gottheilii]
MYIKTLKAGSIIIMFFLIIYLGTLIDWIFKPLSVFVQTLFFPILIAGILFYMFRPVIQLLSRRMSRMLSIVLLFVVLIGLLISFLYFIVPEIERQFHNLIINMPNIVSELRLQLITLQQNEMVQRFGLEELFNWEDQLDQVGTVVGRLVGDVVSTSVKLISTLFSTIILVFIVPFILFYLLKEGEKLPTFFLKFFDEEKRREVGAILTNMDETLSNYIQGVLIVCSFVGVLYFAGFSIIGLDYALILAIIGMVTNIIPYLGPWLGAIPSATIGLLHSPMMALLVLIIIVVIQQVESIIVQPQIIGKKMSIHPVTVLALVLVAGRFIGIIGMVLVIPVYAVVKVLVIYLYRLWKIRVRENNNKKTE